MAVRTIDTAAAAPTPIPAFAPVLKLDCGLLAGSGVGVTELDESELEAEEFEEGVLELEVTAIVLVGVLIAYGLVDDEMDELAGLAAKASKLNVSKQAGPVEQ